MTTLSKRILAGAIGAVLVAAVGCSSAGVEADQEGEWSDGAFELAEPGTPAEPSEAAEAEVTARESDEAADDHDARGTCPYLEAVAGGCPALRAQSPHASADPQRSTEDGAEVEDGPRDTGRASTGCPYLDSLSEREAENARARRAPATRATLL